MSHVQSVVFVGLLVIAATVVYIYCDSPNKEGVFLLKAPNLKGFANGSHTPDSVEVKISSSVSTQFQEFAVLTPPVRGCKQITGWNESIESTKALLDYEAPYKLADAAFANRGAYPVSFSHQPKEWLLDQCEDFDAVNSSKRLEWSTMIPGNIKTYTCSTKQCIKDVYLTAWKAHTWKKAGWDCNRHIEILESGGIPVFRDSHLIPQYTMTLYPKAFMQHIERNRDEKNEVILMAWRHHLLQWGRAFLTTEAVMRYMIRVSKLEAPLGARVAFIDSSLRDEGDYLSAFLLQGLIDVFGERNVDIFFPVSYLFEGGWNTTESDDTWHREAVRNGYYVSHFLKPNPMAPSLQYMEESLNKPSYQLVVWGCQERQHRDVAGRSGVYYINQARGKYKKNQLWLNSCDDNPRRQAFTEFPWTTTFVRELQ